MKSNLAEMSATALAKALKPTSIRSGFATIGIFPFNKATIEAKVGASIVQQPKSTEQPQGHQED